MDLISYKWNSLLPSPAPEQEMDKQQWAPKKGVSVLAGEHQPDRNQPVNWIQLYKI